jgi:hypothetical protein
MRSWLFQTLAFLLGGGLLVLGLTLASQALRDCLRPLDAYTVDFLTIDCPPPADLGQEDFLSEVQYLAGLPSRLQLLDPELAPRLAAAFAQHPWVERVEAVALTPRHAVRVQLVYRRPVLTVQQAGCTRAVDRYGVLLPGKTATDGLPVFRGIAGAPAGPAGTPWGERAVEAAARTAGTFRGSKATAG